MFEFGYLKYFLKYFIIKICQNGKCVQTTENQDLDALRECGNLHHINFKNGNHTGTAYSNSKCLLICISNGDLVSSNSLNEGFPCPGDSNGVSLNIDLKFIIF